MGLPDTTVSGAVNVIRMRLRRRHLSGLWATTKRDYLLGDSAKRSGRAALGLVVRNDQCGATTASSPQNGLGNLESHFAVRRYHSIKRSELRPLLGVSPLGE